MKVLFISSQPINRNYSTGNTIINFFENFPESYTFHDIALRKGKFEPDFFNSALFFSDGSIISSVLKLKPVSGTIYDPCDTEKNEIKSEADSKALSLYRYKHSPVLRYVGLLVRNIFWKFGTWKKAVKDYVKKLNPDIIFYATSGMAYSHNVVHYVHNVSGAPVVLFHADDHYTLKCFSYNPLFWINRLASRRAIKRAVKVSAYNFCITQLQCDEYSKAMHKSCTPLTKGQSFSEHKSFDQCNKNNSLEFVYTGNIFYGRWRTLAYVGELLDKLSTEGFFAILKIYTSNELSKKIKKAFDSAKCIEMMGSVPNTEIQSIQENADVLLHAESFRFAEKLVVRQSFSTKIVDYIHSGRCVLAAGAGDIAPIRYFSDNDIGMVLTGDEKKDLQILKKAFDPSVRESYAKKAWEYGKANHDTDAVEKKLKDAFEFVTK